MFVAAEIHRRGGYAVTFAGDMPGIDILATDASNTRRVSIQVKTKTSGTFMRCGQTSSRASGGERPVTPGSTHHAIQAGRIAQWHDRWDVLRLSLSCAHEL